MSNHHPVPALIVTAVLAAGAPACRGHLAPVAGISPAYDLAVYGDLESLDPSGQMVMIAYPYSGEQEEALLALVDEFNATNQWGISVRGQYARGYEEAYNRIVAALPSGRVPDLSLVHYGQEAAYAAQGAAVELSPYLESRRWGLTHQERADFLPGVLQTAPSPGLYGWPLGLFTQVLFYNADWLREQGYDHPPRTWEEFQHMACLGSNPEAGFYGYEVSANGSVFVAMLLSRGGQVMYEDASAYAFGDEHGLETLTFVLTLLREGCAVQETEHSGDESDFAVGRVLFTIDSTSRLPQVRNGVARRGGFDWSIAPLPSASGAPVVTTHGPRLSVLRTTPQRQLAAWLFVRWLSAPAQQARWTRASGALPVRVSAADLLKEDLADNPQMAQAFALLSSGLVQEPEVPGYGECRDLIRQMVLAAEQGESPTSWLAQTVEGCNATLPGR